MLRRSATGGEHQSFNARLREECLNREQLWTLTEARVVLEDWRWKYNNIRPHRSLGYITPIRFAQKESKNPSQLNARPPVGLRHHYAPALTSSTT